MGWLAELGRDDEVSRSALGRYKLKQDALSGELRRTREVAEALAREFGEAEEDSKIGRVGVEMLHAITMKLTAASLSGRMPDFSPREIHFLARSQKDLMAALDIDDKRRAKIREEALKAAAKAAGSVAVSQGLSPDTAAEIRKAIMGVG